MVLVKRGGRVDYVCDGCGEIIDKGTEHMRAGNSPNFKRYHTKCAAKAEKASAAKTAKEAAAKAKAEAAAKAKPVVKPAVKPAVKPGNTGKPVVKPAAKPTVKPQVTETPVDTTPQS